MDLRVQETIILLYSRAPEKRGESPNIMGEKWVTWDCALLTRNAGDCVPCEELSRDLRGAISPGLQVLLG